MHLRAAKTVKTIFIKKRVNDNEAQRIRWTNNETVINLEGMCIKPDEPERSFHSLLRCGKQQTA